MKFIEIKISDVKKLLPQRPDDMHKGVRGRLLIAGGSEHYPGAPSLSAIGALRSGVGVVTLLSEKFVCSSCASRLPEIVYLSEDDRSKWFEKALIENNFKAVVAGPGLERNVDSQNFIVETWNKYKGNVLIDGDGLFALAEKQDSLKSRNDAILTPHEGEAARLLRTTPDEIKKNRDVSVKKLAEKWGCVVLKGHGTLIASKNRDEIFRVNFGGAELSVPGSGDVLSGCIGAFLAMGLEIIDAAILGVSIHGMAGDFLRKDGVDGVLASEIAHTIRKVIFNLRKDN